MKRKDLYMVLTEVSVMKTVNDIQTYLMRLGASQIMTEFENGEPSALFFKLKVDGREVPFQLPARVEPVYKIMHAGRASWTAAKDLEQAKRVAWRQVYRWIQAQVAMIETGMVDAGEVLFPYVQVGPNETLYKKALASGFQKLLPAPSES